MNSVTCLIAEDEAPQRIALQAQLRDAWPTLEIVAACEDGLSALDAVATHRPQVAFIDIRMPGVSGLDVAKAVVGHGGLVVFTTAYDDYAVRAFEAGAVDYLLKPVQSARLAQAIERLQARLAENGHEAGIADLQSVIGQLEARLRPQGDKLIRWITASIGDSVRMIGIGEVLYFQAQDKYVRVVSADGEAIIRTSLKELLCGLDPDEFWQVHRGVVVRVDAIDRLRKDELGRHSIHLKGRSETLPVSSAFLQRFRGM
ncbi:MAG: response regulator transcription factor [Lysobacteraceae bacterium]|nr:MAG: response regulator transcription factor [Xanthomonadaceae bacterium]